MLSDITDPSLTSVEQHGYKIGEEAVKLLIGRIERKTEMPFQTKIIRTELVIKDSTRRNATIPDNPEGF
jgi:LacI family transcriptional regulator